MYLCMAFRTLGCASKTARFMCTFGLSIFHSLLVGVGVGVKGVEDYGKMIEK